MCVFKTFILQHMHMQHRNVYMNSFFFDSDADTTHMCLSEMYISNPIFCTMVCIRSCIKKKVIGGKPFSVLVILKHIWNFWGILEYFFIHSFVANIHVAELIQHPNFRYLKK